MRSCRLLARPGPAKNRRHRASDQTKVQAEAPPAHVCVAERELARQDLPDIEVLRVRTSPQEGLLVSERHRGEIRDSRPHGQELTVLLGEHVHVARYLRPRSDEAHLAPQHVDELGQLIDLPAAQHAAHARDAWIAGAGDERTRAPGGPHGTKLEDLERLAASPDADLPKEDRSRPAAFDGDCRHREDGAQEDEQRDRHHEVDAPLERVVGRSHATANLRRRPSAVVSRTAAITWSTAASLMPGKIGNGMRRRHSRNATGKSSARWPYRWA